MLFFFVEFFFYEYILPIQKETRCNLHQKRLMLNVGKKLLIIILLLHFMFTLLSSSSKSIFNYRYFLNLFYYETINNNSHINNQLV